MTRRTTLSLIMGSIVFILISFCFWLGGFSFNERGLVALLWFVLSSICFLKTWKFFDENLPKDF